MEIVNHRFHMMWEEAVVDHVKLLPQHLHRRNEQHHETPSSQLEFKQGTI